MPLGLVCLSASLDLLGSLPSWSRNAASDIFSDMVPPLRPNFPTCKLWPTKPPRGHFYCETSMLAHPLVNPITARSWEGSPPIWFAMGGGERFADGVKSIAKIAASQGVIIVWEEYQSMPHLGPMLFKSWPQAQHCWERWAEICISSATKAPVTTKGLRWELKSLQSSKVNVLNLTQLSVDDIQAYVRRHQANVRVFTGEESAKASL